MNPYRHILLAVDFFAAHAVVSDRAQDLAERHGARLSLIHVIENPPLAMSPALDAGYGLEGLEGAYDIELAAELTATAKVRLTELARKLSVAENNIFVEIGSPKHEIIRAAIDRQADLIVVGSHGRHGIALLLGSTANSILHHAQCDVLAVRLPDD